MEGFGSIWNKNSWHWEEKNYTKKATDYLTEKLESVKVTAFTPKASEIKVTSVKECKGSAVISIRKKKQVYIYEFEIECEWEAEEKEGDHEAKGKFRIQEFYQDDDPEDIEVNITAEKSDEYHEECRNAIRQKVKPELVKIVQSFHDLMQKIDSDEAKLRADAEKRMKEEEEMKKAQEEKGHEKDKIFKEQKAKEEQRKLEEAKNLAAASVDETNKGTGSVWNAGSYFWEEKNYNKWSQDKIKELLCNFKHTVPGGKLEVTDTEIEGEAGISIRKGKKIYSYDFVVTLKWTVTLGEGDEESKVTGSFKLPDVSNAVYDDDEPFHLDIEYKTGIEKRDEINDHLRKDVANAIRKNLDKYVTEFKNIDLSK
ncbi:unnamed protein product [Moneuplotes crassus]|uniref:Activator of Hsp90 ATPase AHSA1-like N-terminal domain-containing protein n=2 Tax=Euplotes crassus TaxID=5936 RepID=A0AAD1XJ03_EUPCR|nr:unnamed protein product [Moneuplotes crassus]